MSKQFKFVDSSVVVSSRTAGTLMGEKEDERHESMGGELIKEGEGMNVEIGRSWRRRFNDLC